MKKKLILLFGVIALSACNNQAELDKRAAEQIDSINQISFKQKHNADSVSWRYECIELYVASGATQERAEYITDSCAKEQQAYRKRFDSLSK